MEAGSSLEISLEPVHAFDQDWVSAPALATSPRGSPPASSIHTQEMQHFDAAGMGTPYPSRPPTMPDHFLAIAHPGTGGPDDMHLLPESVVLPSMFTLRGELMHAFVSYRGATEGPAGNGLAEKVAAKIRSMSTDSKQLQIPRHGWGIWPKSAKRPVPFRPEEAKVYLGKDCLQDGQSWLAGFVQGLVVSMTFVPLLSWEEGDEGSLGELSRIGVDGFDRVDNVLLELILCNALREEPGAACQAVLPVIVGPAAPGGGFGPFPFHKLARLSEAPSRATNARAAAILRQLGLGEEKLQAVLLLSVKQVVDSVLRNQGVQASAWETIVSECGARVLTTVLRDMRRLRSDPKYFEQGRPMGSEVLEWLQEENLRSYAPLFVHHRLDSLDYVARLDKAKLSMLFDEYEELYPRSGQKGAMGGELAKLKKAHSKLLYRTPPRLLGLIGARPDERTQPISARLERYRDTEASGMAALTSGNCVELFHTNGVLRWVWVALWGGYAAFWGASLAGAEGAWSAHKWAYLVATFIYAIGAVLPLACRTARVFADAVFPWYACVSLAMLLSQFTAGRYASLAIMVPAYFVQTMTTRYRQRLLIFMSCVAFFLMLRLGNLADCLLGNIRQDSTYGACVILALRRDMAVILGCAAVVLFFVGRKYANDFSARRAAREACEHHRALWEEELSKVAATPEVADGLRRLAGGIARELQEQRRLAVRSLALVRRVMAFLNQRAGRWSLRGHSIKARQAHGDIDLLFDEATMVNEPFLDLIASLVAGIGCTPGRGGGGRVRRRSVTRAGSEEWSAEADSSAKAGLALVRGPIKRPARALQKLVRLYGRDVATLTDLVRCTVIAEDLRQVNALMALLEARSVVGLTGAEKRGGEGDEAPMLELDNSDGDRILRITAIKNRFDESYDDSKTGGYRDLSLNIEVGWTMQEGLVSFEKVRDWGLLECQRHICEIQVRLRSQHHEITSNGLHSRYVELRNKKNT